MGFPGEVIRIEGLDDARVAAYLNLKDRELAREGGRFIAEGELVVRRLLESDFPVESMLVAENRLDRIAAAVRPGVVIYVAPHELVNRIVGFKFHSGIMAVGRRKPPATLEEVAGRWGGSQVTVLVCPDLSNTENLGAILRIAAGFGCDAVVLGPNSCDPYYRQAIRVSMGAVFALPIVQSTDLMGTLAELRQRWGITLAATVLDEAAEPLPGVRHPGRLGLLLGNEAQGLPPNVVEACDWRVTIPMRMGVDSLNVSIAAAVFLYHFTQGENGNGRTDGTAAQ